ncbi:MAG: PatB family C-S lyase [Acidimicrobiaceae bacterium]|nr:PatB family C-S lyase [Acidimicrobiaceae bacterium]MDE0676682.1 PatB family C-S lyase [Acidimicrobiaceae bacterium]
MIFELDAERVRNRPGIKWGREGPDVLAAWVADMDVELPAVVLDAVRERIDSGGLGYDFYDQPIPVLRVFAKRMSEAFGWQVDPLDVVRVHDVIQGLELAITYCTEPGDGVIFQTPAYPPFFSSVEGHGRRVVPNPLIRHDDGWRLDLDHFESVASAPDVTAVILCQPHNPCGMVLDADDIAAVIDIAERHDLVVISDEIHCDLVYAPRRHLPVASVSELASERTVTVTAATKSFNMAGLRMAFLHSASSRYGPIVKKIPKRLIGGIGILGQVATIAGWTEALDWLDELVAGLDSNRRLLAELLDERLPEVQYRPPDATYLAWMDCRELGLGDDPASVFLGRGRVYLNSGLDFGPEGAGHVRLNFATSPAMLDEATARMAKAIGR